MKTVAFALLLTSLSSFVVVTEADGESCKAPERILRAQPLVIHEMYEHGFLLKFKCQPGYIQTNHLRILCQHGKWDNLNIGDYCEPKPCESLNDPDNGRFRLTNHDVFVFGARVEYTCNEGYQMIGAPNRECRVDGWSGRPPICEVKTCLPVTIPEGIRVRGIYDLQQDFLYGTVLRFECMSPQSALRGEKEIYCLDDKTWSHPVPVCKEILCETGRIEFGDVTSTKNIFKNGEILQFQCDNRYKRPINSPSRCTKDGWIPEPLCTPIKCQTTYIENGNFENPQLYNYQETAVYTCNRGYTPSRKEVVCKADGWVPVPTCAEPVCTIRPDSGLQQARPGTYQLGEDATFRCEECRYRYYVSYYCPPDTRVRCTRNGWDPPLGCQGSCSEPSEINHGTYDPRTLIYMHSRSVRYSCENSFTLKGRINNWCSNGEWEFRTPTCIGSCQKPPQIVSGSYQPKQNNYNDRARVTYSCRKSYSLQGSHEIECKDGEWLIGDSPPACIASICSTPPSVTHATFRPTSGPYHVGEDVTYTCDRRYALHGDHILRCGASGWPQKPICFDDTVSCDPPPRLSNGKIITTTPHKIEYKCYNNFKMQGSSTIFCVDGNWTESPICNDIDMKCSQPPHVLGGDFTERWKDAYDDGETLTFECKDYYVLDGPRVIQCIGGQWTSPPQCHEPCVVNQEIYRTKKINLRWKSNGKMYVRHGDRLEFKCYSRHKLETGINPIQYCQDGQIDIPTCYRDQQTKECSALRYMNCSSCVGSEICVDYQWDFISVSRPEPTTLMLRAKTGKQSALFTVTGISEENSSTIAFILKAATNAMLEIKAGPSYTRFNNPMLATYSIPLPEGDSLVFNVTFSGIFSIQFNDIKLTRPMEN